MLSLSEATILSTTLAGILYGISLYMMALTLQTLFRNHRKRRLNYGMVAAAGALLLLSTAEMGVNVARLYEGFITKGPALPGGPESYFSFGAAATYIVKSCLYNAQTIILDAVVIYRAFVVWQNYFVIAVPFLGWCGLVASCVGLNISFSQALTDTEARDIIGARSGHWITAAYSLTLATNLLTTFILALKIWKVARRSAPYMSQSSLAPILRTIIESGAIYSFTITAALITFVLKSNIVYIILDMISPVILIVFSMIIVRVGAASESDKQEFSSARTRSWAPQAIRRGEDSSFHIRDITVEITEVVYRETDDTPLRDVKSPPGISPGGNSEAEDSHPPTPGAASTIPGSRDTRHRESDSDVKSPESSPLSGTAAAAALHRIQSIASL
ncbi:hypothetical protein C8Q80DRAFT_178602 [Daedaleopsis nitida]|nr:hypothetical protein C8Q80DRAFT_178602 [Daedaleopsis nitida]